MNIRTPWHLVPGLFLALGCGHSAAESAPEGNTSLETQAALGCVVTQRPGDVGDADTQTYRWDEATRTVERGTDEVYYRTFDAAGALVKSGARGGSGSAPTFEADLVNDAAGNPIHESFTYAGSAPLIGVWVNTYEAGRLHSVQVKQSRDVLGGPTLTYAYDDAGRVRQVEEDVTSDGTIEARYTTQYDASGRRSKVTRDGSIHHVADGTLLAYITYAYDAQGRITRAEVFGGGFWDAPAGAQADAVYTYRYDDPATFVTVTQVGSTSDTGAAVRGQPVTTTLSPDCASVAPHEPDVLRVPVWLR